MSKIKLTLAAAALVFSLNTAAAPLPAARLDLSSLLNAGISSLSSEVRLGGGGFRMSRPSSASRNFGGQGSKSTSSSSSSSANRSTSSSSNSANSNSSSSANTQRDAQFSNTSRANAAQANAARPAAAAPAAPAGYTGSPFLSSMAGTMTGMLLGHMLFGAMASASPQAEPMTPQRLTDDELKQCLADLDAKIAELEQTRSSIFNSSSDTRDADLAQIDTDQRQLKDLQLVLLKEQIDRLK